MATPCTKEQWSALAALINGQDLLGTILTWDKLLKARPMKSEDCFVWNASAAKAAKASTQTLVQYQVVYSITSRLTTGIPPSSKRSRKR